MSRNALPTPGRIDLSASMMCAHLDELGVELQRLERAGIDSLHFDIMDGHFVPNLALACSSLAALRPLTGRPFTAHFMVDNPEGYVNEAAAAGADTFVFHIEACRYPRRLARAIASTGMVPGVAISPSTAITTLETVADIPCVLIMNVEPGFAGADLIAISPARVRAVRALCGPDTVIGADGHIDLPTAEALHDAGAQMLVCGTRSVFSKQHTIEAYASAIDALRGQLADMRREPAHE
jgi:ribulose-phosphate 3-epimerase